MRKSTESDEISLHFSMNKKTAVDVGLFVISQVVLFYGVRWLVRQMDPMRKKKDESAESSKRLLTRLGIEQMELNEYEQIIASEIVVPEDIQVKFGDIGGLDDIVEALQEAVIYPLTMPHLFQSGGDLLGPPKGVLLYGPPGCGKTMIAKALARESGATFINLHISSLTEKWFGESQKLVKAVFSLARKVQPAIIFIDEIDSFLRERASTDHEVTGMMKAEFMSLWDGMSSAHNERILILGATNRYHDIDKAILRRMPKRFAVGLPKLEQREKILTILLKDAILEGNNRAQFINLVAQATQGFSGSDLKELCRNAVMIPVRETLRQIKQDSSETELSTVDMSQYQARPLRVKDFYSSAIHLNMQTSAVIEDELE